MYRASLQFTAELYVDVIRNGVIIDSRYCGPREPGYLKKISDPELKHAVSRSLFDKFFDPGMALMRKLRNFSPLNVVTTTGVNFMASDFSGTGNISSFNYHDCGTGTNSGGTHAPGAATNATPIVVTDTAHGYTTNDIVTIASYTGNTGANGIWQINPVTTNTYTLLGSVGNGASGGSPTSQRLNGAGDTALVTAFGGSRATGTQSNPAANQYQTVGTLSQASGFPYSIVEWGLFSASSSGTLWDRRWLNTANAPSTTASAALVAAPITLTSSSDSIKFTYVLTINAGGT